MLGFVQAAFPLDISVSLFHEKLVHAVLFSAHKGDYSVVEGDTTLGNCPEGESWYILNDGNLIMVRDHSGHWHSVQQLSFTGKGEDRYFGLKPVHPSLPSREYMHDLHIGIEMKSLLMLNHINLEKYIMGVTESEAGPGCELEYYKVQAILCRTFTLKNIYRHETEGFHLCDGIHCQAYNGRHLWNEDVEIGDEVTNGLVLTDPDSVLLNAVYHSNSGGETRGSEQVWLKKESYLKPVLDRFSLGQPNAGWEKRMSVAEWISYLYERGILEEDFADTASLELSLEHRQQAYCPVSDTLNLSDIREDWSLRSDFFNIIREGNDIILKGRGYGHGVGLSQEGAMTMARMGYHYTEILNYYYHDIRIVHFLDLEDAGIFERKVLHSQ